MSNQRVYTPDNFIRTNFIQNWREIFSHISEYRNLIGELTLVSLTQQYKKTIMGIGWIIVSPLLSVLLWLMLNAAGVFNPGETSIPYPAYVLLSTSIWGFFISFYNSISDTITGNGGVLLQTNFPHIIIVVEKMIVAAINFAIPFSLNMVVLVIYDVHFSWTSLLFPFAIVPLIFLGSALGLLFAVLKIVAVDLTTFFDKSIVFLMYITPVVYARDIDSGILQTLMKYNPLTYLITFPREILVNGTFENPEIFLGCAIGSIFLFVLSVRFFYVSSPVIFEKITI